MLPNYQLGLRNFMKKQIFDGAAKPLPLIAIACLSCLGYVISGCSDQNLPIATPSPSAGSETVTIKETNVNKTIAKAPLSPPVTPDAPKAQSLVQGDISEISNSMCGDNKISYAYGETPNYQVYICADAKEPNLPKYYISRNKDGSGGLDIEASNYNPQKDGAIAFNNSGYVYTLEAPTSQNSEPALRVTFPDGKLTEEPLLRYLAKDNSSTSNPEKSATAPLNYVLQKRQELGVCQDQFSAETLKAGLGSRSFKISDKKYIVQVQCFLGAYQGAFEFVLWLDESPQPKVIPLQFDGFQEPKDGQKPQKITSRAIAGLPKVNVRTQTISNFTKFRGVGDCGSSSLYKLEGDRLVLQEFRAKYECDGEYVQDFPIIYAK
ncbi:MAG: hypothetical protein AUK48_11495 [Oscillatoriales cyanobacterium CG2_30_44_21]|nr:MAG: hypothetical protein AUK48_11495 [Oscillatoriales cyanobacterium CG2_30_44_21]